MLAEHTTHKPVVRLSTSKPEASLEEVKRHIERALHSLDTGPMDEEMRDYLQRTLYTALSELTKVMERKVQ